MRAAAGIEATTARDWSGREEGAASARRQTLTCLAVDLEHRRGGDPGTLGYVGATLPGRARVVRPACEHETLRTGVLVGARGFEPPTSSSRTMRATKLRHAPTEVLVEQSPGIVARGSRPRHRAPRGDRPRAVGAHPARAGPGRARAGRPPPGGASRGPPATARSRWLPCGADPAARETCPGDGVRARPRADPIGSCALPVSQRTTWAPSVAQKYQKAGPTPYQPPISPAARRP